MATPAFTFNDKQRNTMIAVLKNIKTVLSEEESENSLNCYAWNKQASNYSQHWPRAFGRLVGTTDTLLFFGDEAGWSMELNRQQKTFVTTGKHFRVDDLFELKIKNESERNSLIRNVIAPAFSRSFTGKQRIWLVTSGVPAYVLDRLTAIFRAFYVQQNPGASEMACYRNLKFVQIELETGYRNIDEMSRFVDSRWVLSCNTYILRWPAYGPRYPKSVWDTRYSDLFGRYRLMGQAFEWTRRSLVMPVAQPSGSGSAGSAPNGGQSQGSNTITPNRLKWEKAATGARVFQRAMQGQLPMQAPQASGSRRTSLVARTK